MTYKIEFAQFPIEIKGVSLFNTAHGFWRIKDDHGNVVKEIHGLATDQIGNPKQIGGVFNFNDTLKMYEVTKTSDLNFFSDNRTVAITSREVFSGSESEVNAIWGRATQVMNVFNKMGIHYGPLALQGYNSNSTAFLVGRLMGFGNAEPPTLANGEKVWYLGAEKDIAVYLYHQLTNAEKMKGRPLTTAEALEVGQQLELLVEESKQQDYRGDIDFAGTMGRQFGTALLDGEKQFTKIVGSTILNADQVILNVMNDLNFDQIPCYC